MDSPELDEDVPYIPPSFHGPPAHPLLARPSSSRSPSPPIVFYSDQFIHERDPSETHGPLEFRMGHRLIVATIAERIDPLRTVYRLKIEKPSILDYIPILFIRFVFQKFLDFFPCLKNFYPEWFLPSTVILKKRKPDWDDEFEVEKYMYRRLQPLQERFIPYFYGEAIYDGSPALVLSEIIGRRLYDITMKHGEDEEFKRKLEEVYKALTWYGVIHGDTKLDNAIDVGDRVMLIDLEQAEIDETVWDQSTNKGNAGGLLYDLQQNRQCEDEAREWEEKRLKERAEAKAERRRLWDLAYSNQQKEE